MSRDLNLACPNIEEVRRHVANLRTEITIAKRKSLQLDAGIKAREQRLARLESQLALHGGAVLSAPFMSARG